MANLTDVYGNVVKIPGPWEMLCNLKTANAVLGHHWFEPSTLRWFNGRVLGEMIAGRFFISSEREGGQVWDGARRYTIRIGRDDGSISTLGEFGQFATPAAARTFLRKLLREVQEGREE